MKPVKVGIIGCGAISKAYFEGSAKFKILEIIACADIDHERAKTQAEKFDIPQALSVEELIQHPDIEIIINLTIPKFHASLNQTILNAGKHAYCEKPFGLDLPEAEETYRLAKEKNLRVGCAPDTFLGGGGQTCRKLIDDGAIGDPIAATAFWASHGHENWHPNPSFYYQEGGGPMFDMGPYYLTALVNLLGPAVRISGSTKKSFPTRTITSEPFKGTVLPVEVPTHLTGTIDFANNLTATIIMSFDVWGNHLPMLEIHGTEGTLCVPDPNDFEGTILLKKGREKEWTEIPHTHETNVGRGIGVADMAYAIRSGRPHRVNGEMALHVVEMMQSFEKSSDESRHLTLKTTCSQPQALPMNLPTGELDS
ncbi:MAG: Gfo/Idh/MocA family oxidoreductase [Opitutaceae bacterium]|nr:Gfo/Idh/MocA family oxidoreductase [Opitutaceae bacterium]